VVVPDLPGCFSAGDTLEEALGNSQEVILFRLARKQASNIDHVLR
jgi:predicted RNase H-like HicB family nuclease